MSSSEISDETVSRLSQVITALDGTNMLLSKRAVLELNEYFAAKLGLVAFAVKNTTVSQALCRLAVQQATANDPALLCSIFTCWNMLVRYSQSRRAFAPLLAHDTLCSLWRSASGNGEACVAFATLLRSVTATPNAEELRTACDAFNFASCIVERIQGLPCDAVPQAFIALSDLVRELVHDTQEQTAANSEQFAKMLQCCVSRIAGFVDLEIISLLQTLERLASLASASAIMHSMDQLRLIFEHASQRHSSDVQSAAVLLVSFVRSAVGEQCSPWFGGPSDSDCVANAIRKSLTQLRREQLHPAAATGTITALLRSVQTLPSNHLALAKFSLTRLHGSIGFLLSLLSSVEEGLQVATSQLLCLVLAENSFAAELILEHHGIELLSEILEDYSEEVLFAVLDLINALLMFTDVHRPACELGLTHRICKLVQQCAIDTPNDMMLRLLRIISQVSVLPQDRTLGDFLSRALLIQPEPLLEVCRATTVVLTLCDAPCTLDNELASLALERITTSTAERMQWLQLLHQVIRRGLHLSDSEKIRQSLVMFVSTESENSVRVAAWDTLNTLQWTANTPSAAQALGLWTHVVASSNTRNEEIRASTSVLAKLCLLRPTMIPNEAVEHLGKILTQHDFSIATRTAAAFALVALDPATDAHVLQDIIPRLISGIVEVECETEDSFSFFANLCFKALIQIGPSTVDELHQIGCFAMHLYDSANPACSWRWAPLGQPLDVDDAHDTLVYAIPLLNGIVRHDETCRRHAVTRGLWNLFVAVIRCSMLPLALRGLAVISLLNTLSYNSQRGSAAEVALAGQEVIKLEGFFPAIDDVLCSDDASVDIVDGVYALVERLVLLFRKGCADAFIPFIPFRMQLRLLRDSLDVEAATALLLCLLQSDEDTTMLTREEVRPFLVPALRRLMNHPTADVRAQAAMYNGRLSGST